jgi:hypothetical protein
VILELDQRAELVLIEFADPLLDVLRQHEVKECLLLAVIARKDYA